MRLLEPVDRLLKFSGERVKVRGQVFQPGAERGAMDALGGGGQGGTQAVAGGETVQVLEHAGGVFRGGKFD